MGSVARYPEVPDRGAEAPGNLAWQWPLPIIHIQHAGKFGSLLVQMKQLKIVNYLVWTEPYNKGDMRIEKSMTEKACLENNTSDRTETFPVPSASSSVSYQ